MDSRCQDFLGGDCLIKYSRTPDGGNHSNGQIDLAQIVKLARPVISSQIYNGWINTLYTRRRQCWVLRLLKFDDRRAHESNDGPVGPSIQLFQDRRGLLVHLAKTPRKLGHQRAMEKSYWLFDWQRLSICVGVPNFSKFESFFPPQIQFECQYNKTIELAQHREKSFIPKRVSSVRFRTV